MSKEEWKDKGIGSGDNRNLLRIGVVFLAIVSFFTTANGMKEYIFVNNSVIAYSASAAIQGILLALSMNLPGYLREIWKRSEVKGKCIIIKKPLKVAFNLFLCVCVLALTGVTIFCSTWFSYVFIADTIHKDSWGVDSEMLVQQTYRTELYSARDYAHAYRIYLEEKLGENILLLEAQARQIRDTVADFEIDWNAERNTYASDPESMAGSYMSIVINAMETALGEADSQENRDLAATAVADAKINITDRKESIQENLNMLDAQLDNYDKQIASLTNRINRATAGTDTAALTEAINNYTRLITETTQRQADLQLEDMQLESALRRLPYYESYLGLSSSTSSISIRRQLMLLQSEIFKQELDEKRMLSIATDIYDDLRKSSTTLSGDETVEDSSFYTTMLIQMNRFIRNLTDYSEIKDIEANLEDIIDDLRGIEGMSTKPEESPESKSESGSVGEQDGEEQIGNPSNPGEEEASGEGRETESSGEAGSTGETESSGEPEERESAELSGESEITGESEAENELEERNKEGESDKNEQWKAEWNSRLIELKAQVSAMPIYSGSEEIGTGETGGLSVDQINVLHNYDRNNSSKELDDMVRRYISDHNAIYQGIIYLQSPYRSLALFALILAFSFDISGFIFGFVRQDDNMEIVKQENESQDLDSNKGDSESENSESPKSKFQNSDTSNLKPKTSNSAEAQTEWGILKTLKPYIVLTGDYESTDGVYYYKTFRDGLAYRWVVKDAVPYGQGIYISQEIDNKYSKGEQQCPDVDQEIIFAYQEKEPQDGIYKECSFIFDEGSLVMERNNERTFIANMDEYVPVHIYDPNQGQNRTLPAKQFSEKVYKAQIAVVALNAKGTRIAAVYMIECENV